MSNATITNYFTIFFLLKKITFLFTNNHSTHQQFVNFFVKNFVSLALLSVYIREKKRFIK